MIWGYLGLLQPPPLFKEIYFKHVSHVYSVPMTTFLLYENSRMRNSLTVAYLSKSVTFPFWFLARLQRSVLTP